MLQDTEYMPMTDNIIRFFADNRSGNVKKLYTATLHEFGIKDGVAIYRLLKNVV
ncbi:hypothetical protein [Butyrivibrio fibrisolvens]|nr:hypothetical protein [Butyrivibrio fibrisolvens]